MSDVGVSAGDRGRTNKEAQSSDRKRGAQPNSLHRGDEKQGLTLRGLV